MVIYNQQSATVIRHIFCQCFSSRKVFMMIVITSSLPLISLTDRCRPSQCRSCKTLQNNKVYRKCTLSNSFPLRRLRSLEYKAIISDMKLKPGICCSQLKLYGGWRIASLEISLLLSNCFNFFHLSNDVKEEHCQRHNE